MKIRWKNIILLLLCVAGLFYTARVHGRAPETAGSQENMKAQENPSPETSPVPAENPADSPDNSAVPGSAGTEPRTVSAPDVGEGQTPEPVTGGEKKYIRVLIKTQDFAGDYHDSISLVCNGNVHTADGTHSFAPGEALTVDSGSDLFDGEGKLVLVPEQEEAGFTVTSFSRAQGSPTYEGQLEIYRSAQGLLLINMLDLETYLKYVVPSEMPSSYGSEALKAQAVCARTYAYRQIRDQSLSRLHADVDDSVSFQVYNNIDRQSSTDQAVSETVGQVMMCDGEPITAYFFSTSSGSTSTNEVWSEEPKKYLQCVNSGDLESSEPWFRWNVTLPLDYLNKQIADFGIGTLRDIMVLKKSGGGAVDELKLVGSQGEKILNSEYKIREVFSTKGIPVARQDGTTTTEMALMPSAYFTCTPVYENGELTGFHFDGGGYGHGVGLSQNGAKHLAEQGKSWQEILHYFYAEIDLCPIL